MSQERGYQNQRYKATVRPFRPFRQAVAAFDRNVDCGKKGNFFTKLRMWVYGATVEFPAVAIHISLSNGAGSAFTQITPEDLGVVIQKLTEWQTELMGVMPQLEARAATIRAQRTQIEAIARLSEAGRIEPEGFDSYSADDEIPADILTQAQQLGMEVLRKRSAFEDHQEAMQ